MITQAIKGFLVFREECHQHCRAVIRASEYFPVTTAYLFPSDLRIKSQWRPFSEDVGPRPALIKRCSDAKETTRQRWLGSLLCRLP